MHHIIRTLEHQIRVERSLLNTLSMEEHDQRKRVGERFTDEAYKSNNKERE